MTKLLPAIAGIATVLAAMKQPIQSAACNGTVGRAILPADRLSSRSCRVKRGCGVVGIRRDWPPHKNRIAYFMTDTR